MGKATKKGRYCYKTHLKITINYSLTLQGRAVIMDYINRNEYYSTIARLLIMKYNLSDRILDVGCSSGQLVGAFHSLGVEAFGIDISREMICESPNELRDYLINLDITGKKLPFMDGYFELIVLLDVIEHIPLSVLENVLNELRRVLKANGIIYISTPDPLMCKLLGYSDPTHVSVYAKKFWIEQLGNCGFQYLEDLSKKDLKDARFFLCTNGYQKLLNKCYSLSFIPNLRSDLIFVKI
jgi:2-polyprenyl-3-methyl-5-hydroxy-6-metoxy-1,4-benzoquinol methylase